MKLHGLFLGALLLGLGFQAAADETAAAREQAALARLNATEPETVLIQVLEQVENEFPDSSAAGAKVLPLVRDGRPKVRRTAVRVLGILPVDLDASGLADVTKMLASPDKADRLDALKGLRWLYASSAIPAILPLLSDSDEHVRREACRALAIVGDRSLISRIEPLLKDPTADVREDADAAITQLRRKP